MSKIKSEFPQTPLNLTLREVQISTILYCLEGYAQGNDDTELVEEIDEIFEVLETSVDKFCEWGDGDSLDRERVRDILLEEYNYKFVGE